MAEEHPFYEFAKEFVAVKENLDRGDVAGDRGIGEVGNGPVVASAPRPDTSR